MHRTLLKETKNNVSQLSYYPSVQPRRCRKNLNGQRVYTSLNFSRLLESTRLSGDRGRRDSRRQLKFRLCSHRSNKIFYRAGKKNWPRFWPSYSRTAKLLNKRTNFQPFENTLGTPCECSLRPRHNVKLFKRQAKLNELSSWKVPHLAQLVRLNQFGSSCTYYLCASDG